MVSLYLMCSKQTFVFDVLRFQYIAHNIWPLLPLPPEMWGLEVCASCLAPIKVFINWPRFASITPSLGSWVLVAGYNLACPLYFSVDKYEWGYLSASSHLSSFSFCRYILIQTSLLPRVLKKGHRRDAQSIWWNEIIEVSLFSRPKCLSCSGNGRDTKEKDPGTQDQGVCSCCPKKRCTLQ